MAQPAAVRGQDGDLIVLGINGPFYQLSAAVVRGTKVLAAAQEEGFTGIKNAKPPEKVTVDTADQLPTRAIRWCLQDAGISWKDVDLVGYSYDPDRPVLVEGDEVVPGGWGSREGERIFQERIRRVPGLLSELADTDLTGRFRWLGHHETHVASAWLASPFNRAAVLSVDGRGESTTTLLGHGRGTTFQTLHKIAYPDSLGFLAEAISLFLGLPQFEGPGQLMGLAAWGNPAPLAKQMEKILIVEPDGLFRIDNSITRFRLLERDVTAEGLEELFGRPRRQPGAELDTRDANLAAAWQTATEQALLAMVRRLRAETGADALCLAGGVALNCVATGRILREGGYPEGVFVQPAAGDAGTALGAALHLLHTEGGQRERYVMRHPYLGPAYSDADITRALDEAGLAYRRCADVVEDTAQLLAAGKVVGWFQGRAEFGPRALGNRSLLFDPRDPLAKDRVNLHVKHRRSWRPIAPTFLAELAEEWLEVGPASLSHGFMNYTYPVRPEQRHRIPAVVHADGCTRAQLVTRDLNELYWQLIRRCYELTGIPAVGNTSLNGPGQPIALTPANAAALFGNSGMDALAIGPFLVLRDGAQQGW
jgi:carbamoyltransferase